MFLSQYRLENLRCTRVFSPWMHSSRIHLALPHARTSILFSPHFHVPSIRGATSHVSSHAPCIYCFSMLTLPYVLTGAGRCSLSCATGKATWVSEFERGALPWF